MPNQIQSAIKAKIDSFASQLEALVRQAALEAVGGALGTPAKRGRPAGSGKQPAAVKPAGRKGGKRQRRSPEALGSAADSILQHIKSHPGQRSEEVRSALGIAKSVWVPAITTLLEQKKVAKKGVKRATTYSAK